MLGTGLGGLWKIMCVAAAFVAGITAAAADPNPPTLALTSLANPRLGKVCVVGYSVQNAVGGTIPGYYLTASNAGTPATWVTAPTTATQAAPLIVRAYALGTEIASLPAQPATGTYINSANLRFYAVSPTTSCESITVSIYFQNQAQSIGVPTFFYPSALVEFTTASPGTLTIDVSNVDNFQLPLSLGYTASGTKVGLGNPLSQTAIENRQTMIIGGRGGTPPFIAWLQGQPGYQAANGPKIFARLMPQNVGLGFVQLQSPTDYLAQKCLARAGTTIPAGCAPVSTIIHLDDPLAGYFKNELATFFGAASGLVVMGDGVPPISEQAWTVTSTTANCPAYVVADQKSLQFTAPGQTPIIVCNPIGSVVPLTSGRPTASNLAQTNGTATLTLTAQQAAQYQSKLGWSLVQPESGFVATIGKVTPAGKGATVPLTVVVQSGASAQQACTTGCPTPNFAFTDWYFSEIVYSGSANPYEPLSQMVFANDGAFGSWLYPSSVEDSPHTKIRLSIERNIVSAFSRGIANCNNLTMKVPVQPCTHLAAPLAAPAYTGATGASDAYWANEANWYPAHGVQNYYAQYLHTARLNASGVIFPSAVGCAGCFNIFRPLDSANAANSNQTLPMGMAYGFAYDENPPYIAAPVQVPSKQEGVPFSSLSGNVTIDVGCIYAGACASSP